MAIPSEYKASGYMEGEGLNIVTIGGGSNIKHPIYAFTPIRTRQQMETIGPNTNPKTGDVLHPDMHDNDPDRGRTNAANHETQFSPYIPGYLQGQNYVQKDGYIVAYGQLAVYLKKTYVDIDNPMFRCSVLSA